MKKILPILVSIIPLVCFGQKSEFRPDVSVAGIRLQDVSSVELKFPHYRELPDFPIAAEIFLLNSDESETLTISFYPGADAYSPMEFHVTSTVKKQLNKSKTVKLNVSRFKTENNIKLNILKDDLIKIMGKGFKLENYGEPEIVKYRINNVETSDFLESYGLTEYFADFAFQKAT
jgi:hypothetical protein